MRIRITRNVPVEIWNSEKFSYIYMEVQIAPSAGGFKELAKVKWHLEDENRPTAALCGQPLEGVCRAVSPALAMLGKPCDDCKAIVKAYLSVPKRYDILLQRCMNLIGTDIPFRGGVSKVVDPVLMSKNLMNRFVEPDAPELKKPKRTRAKK